MSTHMPHGTGSTGGVRTRKYGHAICKLRGFMVGFCHGSKCASRYPLRSGVGNPNKEELR